MCIVKICTVKTLLRSYPRCQNVNAVQPEEHIQTKGEGNFNVNTSYYIEVPCIIHNDE